MAIRLDISLFFVEFLQQTLGEQVFLDEGFRNISAYSIRVQTITIARLLFWFRLVLSDSQ